MALKLLQPKLRFEGWEPSGMFKRPADTRTVDELKASVEAWARRVPEVKQILPELKAMNKSQLGLVADTIELSQKKATSWADVDMLNVPENWAFSALDTLMSIIPIAAKKNPHSIDFSNEVINTAGQLTSKYYLNEAAKLELLVDDGVDKNFQRGVSAVDSFVSLALNAPANGKPKFDRQNHFIEYVLLMLDKETNVDKLPLLQKVLHRIHSPAPKMFDIDEFLTDKTPIKTIEANLKNLQQATNHAYSFGIVLDVNKQLSKDPADNTIFRYIENKQV